MTILIPLAILIFSVVIHELAHGVVADRLGDPTPRLMKRLTFDPRPHIDTMWSIILPLLLIISGSPIIIGGAKPMPVDPFNLKEGRKDIALVALAGPLSNILLAIIASLFLKLPLYNNVYSLSYLLLVLVIKTNLLLAIFNLLPIPPLDGSKVFAMLLPQKEANAYLGMGQMGMFIVFFLLLFPIGGFSLGGLLSTLLTFAQNLLLP